MRHRGELVRHHILAWDLGRLISTARSALTAGYLDASEASAVIRDAGERLRAEYGSWQEYGDDFLLGLGFWNTDAADPHGPYAVMIRWLQQDERSPWKRLPFGAR